MCCALSIRQILKPAFYAVLSLLFELACISTAAAAEGEDAGCAGCHGTEGLSTQFPGGERLSLTIDVESFQSSVHGELSCKDCHKDLNGYPHPAISADNYRDFQIERYRKCQGCHPYQYQQALDGTHGRKLAAGNRDAAICVDCHGSHEVARPDQSRQMVSANCGQCHREIYAEYLTSAHGEALLQISNPDVPACTDCHGTHRQEDPTTMAFRLKSPKICGRCHGNAAMMRKYNLSHRVFDTYVADFHGSTVMLFEKEHPGRQTNEAVCTDCHGVHRIQKVSNGDPQAIKQNLLSTCRRCHPDATADFPDSWVGHFAPTRDRFPLVYYINLFYRVLIPVTIGGMTIFVLMDATGRIRRYYRRRKTGSRKPPEIMAEKKASNAVPRIPRRFTIMQQIEHAVLTFSFTALAFTGFIQAGAAYPVVSRIIYWLGGHEALRICHRKVAVVFVLLGVYHLIVVSYKAIVRREHMAMGIEGKDISDARHLLRYNLLMTEEPPQMPRYTFAEKLEYWSLLWGSAIMGLTGLLLLNPLVTARYLPSQFIPAAKAAHVGEAILAVLAIIVWHFYHVHVKAFNRSMFTGRLTAKQMEEEHGHELKRLIAGEMHPLRKHPAMRRHLILFASIAIAVTVVGVGTIYWAATVETSRVLALPVKPKRGVNRVAAPESSSRAAAETVLAPLVPHFLADGKKCHQCHGPSAIGPMPHNHRERPLESCRICHKPSPDLLISATDESLTGGQPGFVPHSIEEGIYRNCTTCHNTGEIRPFPANHTSYTPESCTACHQPALGNRE
ncbi:MAG: cytochrome c3 family protein [Acidobacteria bacterium]|nr:cytochrome c3 family protein [Acidobacteriota bacterium]